LIWRLDCPAVIVGELALENVTRSPVNEVVALTENVLLGEVVPIPTLPSGEMLNHCTPEEEATVKILSVEEALPVIANLDDGVEVPTPIFPLASIVKKETPVDDATLNGFRLEVEVACILKAKVEDVALTPVTVPLSKKVEVPKVVVLSQRVAKPS